jgi:phosphoserine phosphatase RsbU/P
VVVADVAGKGISAALLMAKLAAETRYELVSEADPAVALSRINAHWEDRIVTMAIAVIDLVNHAVQIVNAGHTPPLLRHSGGEVEQFSVDEAGLPLGVGSNFEYRSFTHPLAAGDTLVMFTDGISEAMDAENALYGAARLEKQLRRDVQGVRQLGEQILDDLRQFVGQHVRHDDMCLLCFGRVETTFHDDGNIG